MLSLGLDIATTTGWAFFNDAFLVEKSSIHIPSQMNLPQRLNYFHLELKAVLERLKPEYVFMEDVILGISGAQTLAYLSRLNGVAISTAFSFVRDNIRIYTPGHWKLNSFSGLNGMSKKWEIQLAAIKYFNIEISGNFDFLKNIINERDSVLAKMKSDIDINRTEINKLRSSLNRKRNIVHNRDEVLTNLKILEDSYITLKKMYKDKIKEYDTKFHKISMDISAQTGITENVADACGVCLCGYRELTNGTDKIKI